MLRPWLARSANRILRHAVRARLDRKIQGFTTGLPSSISLSHMGDISTFAFDFCGRFVYILANFATTLANFARLATLHLPQPDPTKRKFANARMPDRVILLDRTTSANCEPSSIVVRYEEPAPHCNKLHLRP